MNHALRLLAASLLLLLLIAAACQRQAIAQEGVSRESQRAIRETPMQAPTTNWTMTCCERASCAGIERW